MGTLTYSRIRINLGVGTFILTLILSSACEEIPSDQQEHTFESCEDKFYECDDSIPEVGDIYDYYCYAQHPVTTEGRLESCADFRRGQMCQCLGMECTNVILHPPESTVEMLDVMQALGRLYCPQQEDYDKTAGAN
jgi:hypothetical protein